MIESSTFQSKPLENVPNVELVRQLAADGGDQALAELIRRHAERCLHTAQRVLGDHHLAEESVQDAFLRLAAKAHLFRGGSEGEFRNFFYRLLLNCCFRYSQKASRRREHGVASAVIKNLPVSTRLVDVSRRMREEEARRLVRWAIDRLPEKQRACLILRELEGMAYKEIAEVLNASLNDVRVWIHRGRKRLKVILENAAHEDLSAYRGGPEPESEDV